MEKKGARKITLKTENFVSFAVEAYIYAHFLQTHKYPKKAEEEMGTSFEERKNKGKVIEDMMNLFAAYTGTKDQITDALKNYKDGDMSEPTLERQTFLSLLTLNAGEEILERVYPKISIIDPTEEDLCL